MHCRATDACLWVGWTRTYIQPGATTGLPGKSPGLPACDLSRSPQASQFHRLCRLSRNTVPITIVQAGLPSKVTCRRIS